MQIYQQQQKMFLWVTKLCVLKILIHDIEWENFISFSTCQNIGLKSILGIRGKDHLREREVKICKSQKIFCRNIYCNFLKLNSIRILWKKLVEKQYKQ